VQYTLFHYLSDNSMPSSRKMSRNDCASCYKILTKTVACNSVRQFSSAKYENCAIYPFLHRSKTLFLSVGHKRRYFISPCN